MAVFVPLYFANNPTIHTRPASGMRAWEGKGMHTYTNKVTLWRVWGSICKKHVFDEKHETKIKAN